MAQQKIRIRLKGYDLSQLDKSAKSIVETAQRTGAIVTGPVPLPTEKNVYTVIRGPFKDKDSREHFEIRTHKRLIDIHSPTPKTVGQSHAARPACGHRHRDQALGPDSTMKGIIGRKVGMTQLFDEETGDVTAVTVIQAGPCPVVQVRTIERDGYEAAQLAFGEVSEWKLAKGEIGHLKRNGFGPHRELGRVPRLDGAGRGRHGDCRGVRAR